MNSKRTVAATPAVLIDDTGQVLDEVKQILDLIAESDAVVSAGHTITARRSRSTRKPRCAVKRLFLNHPTYVNEGSMDDIRQLVGMGVRMEHSICMFIPSTFHLFDDAHLADCIRAAGVENTLFGSDLGQKNNPTPVEGFRAIIEVLIWAIPMTKSPDDRHQCGGTGRSGMSLRQRIKAGELVVGPFQKTPSPQVTADRHGKAAGLFVTDAARIAPMRARGVTVFVCGSDQGLLRGGAHRKMTAARES